MMPRRRIRGVWAIFASLGIGTISTFVNYFDIQNSTWANINGFLSQYLGAPPNLLPAPYGNLEWAIIYAVVWTTFLFTISFSVALEAQSYGRTHHL